MEKLNLPKDTLVKIAHRQNELFRAQLHNCISVTNEIRKAINGDKNNPLTKK